MILTTGTRLLYRAITQANLRLLVLTLDLIIPPLSLFVILLSVMCLATGLATILGFSATPLIISVACFLAFALVTSLTWLRYGRDILPLTSAFSIFAYILSKFAIYRGALTGNADSRWVRTDRDKSE